MSGEKFRLEVSYDSSTGNPVAAYVRIRDAAVSKTDEIGEGVAFADYGADGRLVGIELLAPVGLEVLAGISERETDEVKRFLLEGVGVDMICASRG
jgi:uncharacterized protein YuzE